MLRRKKKSKRRSERSREKGIRRRLFKRKENPSREMDKKTLSELSKLMAYILRHDKEQEFHVDLDKNCSAGINQLVKAIASTDRWSWVNRKHIEEVATKSFYRGKRRFMIKGNKIKVTYRITRKCPSTSISPPKSPLPSHIKENEYYVITSKHSGKCLDVSGISKDKRANIIQYDYWGGDNQKWKLKPVGNGYYCIIAKHSGKCLDVGGISNDNGARIIQYDYWGGDNQKWKLKPVGNGYYRIIAKHSGKCLDVNSKSKDDGAMIQQFRYMDGDNQKWKLEPVKPPIVPPPISEPVTTQKPPIHDPTSEFVIAAEKWFNRGLKAKDLLKKIEYLTKALGFNPKHARAWRNKGYALNDLKRYEEAINCFDKAIEIDPRNARVWRNKGYTLNNLGRYEEAINCFDTALEIDSKVARAWRNKGYALENLGRYEEVIACFDKALEIDSKNARAWSHKGYALNTLKRYEEAMTCLDKALKINPNYVSAWNHKGYALNGLGLYEEAIICFDKAHIPHILI